MILVKPPLSVLYCSGHFYFHFKGESVKCFTASGTTAKEKTSAVGTSRQRKRKNWCGEKENFRYVWQ